MGLARFRAFPPDRKPYILDNLDYVQKISRIQGVSAVQERLWGYYFDPVTRANFTIMSSPLCERGVILGKGISDLLKAPAGSTISLRGHDGWYKHFTVRGVYDQDSALVSSDLILISEENFRKLFGVPGGLSTDLVVTVRNKKEVAPINRVSLRAGNSWAD